MSKKAQGIILVIVGIVLVLLGLAADSVGLGSKPGIGMLQLACLAAGVIVAIVGGLRARAPGETSGD
jgi:hypothetical protein